MFKKGDKIEVVEVIKGCGEFYRIGDKGVVVRGGESGWIDVDFGGEDNIITLYEYEAKLLPQVDLSNKKINVKRYADEQGISLEEAHKEIQTWLFENGCKWASGDVGIRYTHRDYLSTGMDNDMFQLDSEIDDKQELTFTVERSVTLTPVLVEPPVETVELKGKKYDKSELEKALQHIKPLED